MFAQESQSSGLSGVSFPITELGGCTDKASCKSYCDAPENFDACMAFAEKHGFVKQEQAEKYRSFAAIVKDKGGPGGCTNQKECRLYCSATENIDECLEFAEKTGTISEESIARAKRMVAAMRSGDTPGGCNSESSCRQYCSREDNMDSCIAFAESHNLASESEIALIRKISRDGGPGGCRGQEECATFCNKKENVEACFAFAKENGFISEEQIEQMKEGVAQIRIGIEQAPPEIRSCLKAHISDEKLARIEAGEFTPATEIGEKMRSCFERNSEAMRERLEKQFKGSSEELRRCISEATKNTIDVDSLAEGDIPKTPETADKIRACVDKYRPNIGTSNGGNNNGGGDNTFRVPGHLRACLEAKGYSEVLSRVDGGQVTPEAIQKIRVGIETCARAGLPNNEQQERPSFSPNGEDRVRTCLVKLYGVNTFAEAKERGISFEEDSKLEVCLRGSEEN